MKRIYEFRWNSDFTPYFRLEEEGRLEEKILPFDKDLSIELVDDRACTGYEKFGDWQACELGEKGVKKCENCKKKEGLSAIQYCDGFNTDMFGADELKALNSEHYLYFALFDREIIKVGVSATSRGFLRQIEQGAQYSMIIADQMWGVPARQMETIIRRTGVIDKVQISQKKDLFLPKISKAEASEILYDLAKDKLSAVVAHRDEFKQFVKQIDELIIQDWSDYYHLSSVLTNEKPLIEVELENGEGLSGKLVAAKGPFLLFETNREYALLDAKSLKGMAVDFSNKEYGLHKKSGFQTSLF